VGKFPTLHPLSKAVTRKPDQYLRTQKCNDSATEASIKAKPGCLNAAAVRLGAATADRAERNLLGKSIPPCRVENFVSRNRTLAAVAVAAAAS
jgi:hypothetical protein